MSADPQLRLCMADDGDVPKEFTRAIDPHLLPPRVGHNWNDQAFRKHQEKPQQLEGEFRGKRVFPYTPGNTEAAAPPDLCLTAQQLAAAIAASSRNRNSTRCTNKTEKRFMTLDDKVLRFYAFFREPAPEGGAADFWHRKVVICFYPSDDTIMIDEPYIPNSGLDGGIFLRRQKVVADPRQREYFPDDEFVNLNHFNVGHSVRLNSTEFFLYDCDGFTRSFLKSLGVDVGKANFAPDDISQSDYGRYLERLKTGSFGLLSQNFSSDESERAARFLRDSGKMLRFYAILDERKTVAEGGVRKLEVLMFVEDGTIAVLERQNSKEECPGLFLSRCWLPKCGSVARLNELTFLHRVNGQKEPDMGIPDAYYRDVDLDLGVSINVLNRSVLLYDCDDFTREFFMERYGKELHQPVDISEFLQPMQRTLFGTLTSTASSTTRSGKSKAASDSDVPSPISGKGEVLRFRAALVDATTTYDQHRRFTVAFYSNTNEVAVFEIPFPKAGINGGFLWKKRKVMKLPPKAGPRNEPKSPAGAAERPYYTITDLGVGRQLVVNGLRLRLTAMDAYTESYYTGKSSTHSGNTVTDATGAVVTVSHLLSELREFLRSRVGTGIAAFLALDRDRDGIVSLPEFSAAMRSFQITEDAASIAAIFSCIAGKEDTAYFTSVDLLQWMNSGLADVEKRPDSSRRPGLPEGGEAVELVEIEQRALRSKVLRELKSRLDARCWKGAEMFRLASTMPRAYRGRRADLYSLHNPDRDTVITPVQLRRCLEEVLSAIPTTQEMNCLLSFFFPEMPAELFSRSRDDGTRFSVDLKEFQKRYQEMTKETMLPDTIQLDGVPNDATSRSNVETVK